MWQYASRFTDEWLDRLPPPNSHGQHVVNVVHSTHTVMLLVIAAAGFGRELPWPGEEGPLPAHHKMPFLTAMQGMFDNLTVKAALPAVSWPPPARTASRADVGARLGNQGIFKLPFAKLQMINSYFTSFEQHVLEMVDERRALGAEGIDKGDLFSNLIRASDAEEGNARLNKIEMLSNIHIFMLAGHETTAHTCLACLT